MYKVMGGDQREYGPVTAEQIRQWIAQRRLTAETRVRLEPSGEWIALGAVPEFAATLNQPPVLGGGAVASTESGPPETTSGLAIASLALGIFGACVPVILSLTGLILGIVGLQRITASRGRIGGRGLAIAGIAVSGVTLLFVPFFFAIQAGLLLPALARAKVKANQINSASNMKQLALAARMYANNNGDKFPPAATWCDALQSTIATPKIFLRPGAKATDRCSYGYNERVAGKSVAEVAPNTILFFELEDGGWNVSGGPSLLRRPPPGRSSAVVVALADGSVQQVTPAALAQMRWDP